MSEVNQSVQSSSEMQEFIAYDLKGNPVVLRSNSKTHEPHVEAPDSASPSALAEAKPSLFSRGAGSLRFFGDAKEVATALKSKPTRS